MKILRTGAILIVLTVFLVIAGGALGGRSGMEIALVIAVLMNGVSYFFRTRLRCGRVERSRLPASNFLGCMK